MALLFKLYVKKKIVAFKLITECTRLLDAHIALNFKNKIKQF